MANGDQPKRAEIVAENIYIRLIARVSMAAIGPILGLLFVVAKGTLDEITDNQAEQTSAIQGVVDKLGEIKLNMNSFDGRLNTIDALRGQKDQEQDRRLDDHDRRINGLTRRADASEGVELPTSR